MTRNTLFLLDAMALLYRAHFAFISNPRITSKGLNTSAIFGFTNTLLEIINKENPSHLAVAFDTTAPTFRHVEFPDYKGHRDEMPEDLSLIIPYVYKLLDVLKIPVLKLDGYEADDIMGTVAWKVPEESFDVYLVTPDKDFAQLVKDNVFLYRPRYKGGGFDVLKREQVLEKYGILPEQVIDFLGLKGDASDNIPGVPKIGDKTAISLLSEYNSVENILANLDQITKKSVKASLTEFGEQGLLSKRLATIHTEVPFEWTVEDLVVETCDLEELLALMKELEFRTTGERILNSKLNPMSMQAQTDLFGNPIGNRASLEVESGLVESFEKTEQHYELLDTPEKRAKVLEAQAKGDIFCFDTETTGLDPMKAELVGVSFSQKAGEAYYVPCPEDVEETKAILSEFVPLFSNPKLLKIGQNLKYDLLILKNYGVEVVGPMFDTMLAHYVINPSSKHGMDAMADELLNYQPISIETLIGKKGKKQKSMRDVPVEDLVNYAAEDADITLRLYERLEPEVKENTVFSHIEQALMPVLTAMEFEGIRIDENFLKDYSIDLKERLKTLEKEIYSLAGEEFNINSPKQLGDILFEKLELGKGRKAKKTKTGQYSTNEQILVSLATKHELPAQVLAYRGITKLKSTYVDALPALINPKTGRVHTTYSQSVAVTGRLSSNNPNLQNIPIRTDDGREVRKGFIPRDSDHVLLSADYSQVELRLMASMSEDPAMIEAFNAGEDIHRAAAARVFGKNPEDITSSERSYAKQVNFGIIYGISPFGLAQRIGISRTEAKDIIDTYFETYPNVKAYMDQSIELAKEQGYVETLFGRKRYLPEINSKNHTVRGFAERNAINSPIQGTAADIIKLAMISLYAKMREKGFKSRMILQVHDELVFDVHKSELEELKPLVRKHMMEAAQLKVPLEVEMGTGENWLEAH